MERLDTRLDGLVLLAPAVHGDERGFFMETYREDAWAEHGHPDRVRAGQPLALAARARCAGSTSRRTPARASSCAAPAAACSTSWSTCGAARRPSASGRRSSSTTSTAASCGSRSASATASACSPTRPTSSTSAPPTTTAPPRRGSASTIPTSGSSGRRTSSSSTPSATAPPRGCPRSPTGCRSATRVTAGRPLRPQPDRDAARRQPAHGAARVAVRALAGRALPRAHGGPRPGPRALRVGDRAARGPARDRARLGRRGALPVRAPRRPTRRRSSGCGPTGASTSASARGPRSAPPPRRRTGRCPRAPTRAPACG